MVKRPKRTKRPPAKRAPAAKRPTAKRPPSATAEGRTQLLLEDIRHQNRAVMDAVSAQGQRLERLIGELREEHSERIGRLEFAVGDLVQAVRKNSTDIIQNSKDIRQNSEDIRRMDAKLDRKADSDALQALGGRVAAIERAVKP